MKKRKPPFIIAIVLLVCAAGAITYFVIKNEDTPSNGDKKAKTCTTYNNTVKEQCTEDYVGLTQSEAMSKAKRYEYLPKIESIDGIGQVNTDERGPIIYFVIKDGVVAEAHFLEDL